MILFEVFCIQLCRFHYDSKPKLVAIVDVLVRRFLFFFGRKLGIVKSMLKLPLNFQP